MGRILWNRDPRVHIQWGSIFDLTPACSNEGWPRRSYLNTNISSRYTLQRCRKLYGWGWGVSENVCLYIILPPPPPPTPQLFLFCVLLLLFFACHFQNSYGPAFSRILPPSCADTGFFWVIGNPPYGCLQFVFAC